MRSFLAVQIVHPIRIIEFMKKGEIICNLKLSKMSAGSPALALSSSIGFSSPLQRGIQRTSESMSLQLTADITYNYKNLKPCVFFSRCFLYLTGP